MKKAAYIIIFIFIFLICLFIPYASDDWAWGSIEGIERFKTFFIGYNGRIFGNILIMLLSRSFILKTLIMFLTISGILIIIKKLMNNSKVELLYLLISAIILFLMPNSIFRQTIGWVSGFANYVFSTFSILLFLFILYLAKEKKLKDNNIFIVCSLILGLVNSLIVEHITIYNVILSFVVLIYMIKTNSKYKKIFIFYFIGSIIGSLLMFLNPVYYAEEYKNYKSINTNNFLVNSLIQYKNIIYHDLIANNLVLNLVLSFTLIFIYFVNYNKINTNIKEKIIIKSSVFIIIVFSVYNIILNLNPAFKSWGGLQTELYEATFSILYLLAIFLIIFYLVLDKNKKKEMLFVYFSIILITLPLLIVSPITSRCFFAQYVFWIILVLQLINYIVINKKKINYNLLVEIFIVVFVPIIAFYMYVYSSIFKSDLERIKYIDQQLKNDSKEIEVIKLPYNDTFLWYANPHHVLYE